jgi:molybdate transport system substrate-binding protein
MLRLTAALLAAAGLLAGAQAAAAAEIKVMISGGFTAALQALAPRYEAMTGDKVVTISGSSMGSSPTAIPARLAKGEPADVLIMVGEALDGLADRGRVVPASRTTLALSEIGMSVKAGAPRPDISTVDALRRTLLDAKSIAYSASASGVYVSTELFDRLGVAAEVRPKAFEVVTERVGTIVARGEAEIGFQQVSELLPIVGADFVGTIPAEVQKITVYSAGVAAHAAEPARGQALIAFLASPAAAEAVAATGLTPPPARAASQ